MTNTIKMKMIRVGGEGIVLGDRRITETVVFRNWNICGINRVISLIRIRPIRNVWHMGASILF